MRNKKFITLMMCFLLSCASVGVMSACNKDKGKDSTSGNGSSVGVSSPADSSSESSKVIEYKVTFNSNGGSNVENQLVKNGAKATKPADPTRDGHTFVGWMQNGKTYDFDTRVTADINLIAKWEKNAPTKFTVSFMVEGETEAFYTTSVEAGNKVAPPKDTPTRTGFIFDGWTLKGEVYDFTAPVIGEMTLMASWKALPTIQLALATGSESVIAIDGTTTLTATADWGEIEWSSSDETIATVENGVVKGLKGGDVTITASIVGLADIQASMVITVKTPSLAVEFAPTSKEMIEVGATTSLIATTDWKVENVVWSTSDETIATVENGVVTAVKGGEVTITATLAGAMVEKTVYVVGDGLYSNQIGARVYGNDVSANQEYLKVATGDNEEMVITAKFKADANYSPALIVRNMYSKSYYETLIANGYTKFAFELAVEGDMTDLYVFGKPINSFPQKNGVYMVVVDVNQFVTYYDTMFTIATSANQVGQASSISAKFITWKSPAGDFESTKNYVFTISNAAFSTAPESVEVDFAADGKELIDVGETTTLTVSSDWDTSLALWMTSDESVATVDDNGVVTAVSGGQVTIKATIGGVSASKTVYVFTDKLLENQIGSRINGNDVSANQGYFKNEIGDDGEMTITAKFQADATYSPALTMKNMYPKAYYEELIARGYTRFTFELKVEGDVTDLYVFGKALNSFPVNNGVYAIAIDTNQFVSYYDTMYTIATSTNKVGQASSLSAKFISWKSPENEWAEVRNYVFTIYNAGFKAAPEMVEIEFATESSEVVSVGETTTLKVNSDWNSDYVVWTCSDESIATIKDGVVTAVKGGEVTITATIAGVASESKTVYVVGDGLYSNQIGARINGWNVSSDATYCGITEGTDGEITVAAKFQASADYSPALIVRNMYSKAYYEKLIEAGYEKLTFTLGVEGEVTDLYVFGKKVSNYAKTADGLFNVVVDVQHFVSYYDTIYTIATSGSQVGQSSSMSAKFITWKSPAGDYSSVRDYVFTISDATFRKGVLFTNDIGMRVNGWDMTTNTTYMTMETGANGEMIIDANWQAYVNYGPALVLKNVKDKSYYQGLIDNGYTYLSFDLKVGGTDADKITDVHILGSAQKISELTKDGDVYKVQIQLAHIVQFYDTIVTLATSGSQAGQWGSRSALLLAWRFSTNFATVPEQATRNYVFTISNADFTA